MARPQNVCLEDITVEYAEGTSAWPPYCYCLKTQKKDACLPQLGTNE